MRIIGSLAALAAAGVLAASAGGQVVYDPKLDACGLSISYLAQIRDGADDPKGIESYPRIKAEKGYRTDQEEALYLFDGYTEYADVRANCEPAKWPAEVKVEGLRAAIQAAVNDSSDALCGAGTDGAETPASIIPKWLANPEVRWFHDRALELNNQIDLMNPETDSMDRHLSESEWLRDVAKELVAACKPNDAVKPALAAAELSLKVAKDNDAFRDCVKARDGYKPQLTAFDAAARTQDAKAMKAAYAALDTAAKPVKNACKPSEEGAKEIDYILASRKMQISFLEVPGCRDAAKLMNDQRTAMNATAKADIPAAATRLRKAAKDARKACKNDPAPQVWGEFVAWIAVKNLTRTP